MSIKEQIRAEIERRMETYNRSIDEYFGKKKSVQAERDSWKWAECKSILSFLDTLPEQPKLKSMNIPSAGGGMSTTPPSYKLDVKPEQPVEDLNELIRKWDRVNINTIQKAKVKTTGEIIDGFYDGRGHFDHFVDHDIFDRYSVEDVEPIIDKQPVEGLEEEIKRMIYDVVYDLDGPAIMGTSEYLSVEDIAAIARHFAEWQYQKDRGEFAKLKAKEWSDGYNEGIARGKEKMLEDAVEIEVKVDAGGYPYIDATELYDYENDKPLAKAGDKVRMIVLKAEEE